MKKSVIQLFGCVVACSFFSTTLAHHKSSHVTKVSLHCGSKMVAVENGDKYSAIQSQCGDQYFKKGKGEVVTFNPIGKDAASSKSTNEQVYTLKVKDDIIQKIKAKKQNSSS
ncbi:MAG: hypothetical protein A3F10_03260 [Coxiella sp. RIFCSPHIGHO2_12_FULL_42_15]|nr:MAG: hypothetical protein A3F10_03260 [Coxiella sp. RIFCSPHIGHO2_12_FULL_42_15]